MKKIYRKILSSIVNFPKKIEVLKSFVAEWIAIFKKAPLYKNLKWTKQQQKEFDLYWKKNYGKKISNRWHRLYEACNGVHRVDYLPEILFTTNIEPKANDFKYSSVFSDKTLLDIFFNNRIENVRTPIIYLFNNHGLFYDKNHCLISKEKALQIFANIGEAVIKPSVDSSSGTDVIILNMQNGKNIKDGTTGEDLFDYFNKNFIVQEKIKPHKLLKDLYSGAINTLRITSYILNDKVEVVPISLRIGSNGGNVDNIHAGGIGVYVKEDGTLSKYAYRLGNGDNFEKIEKHPDTNIVFDGYKLDFISDVIASAKRLHELTANTKFISWDFTVDENGDIVVIEANYRGQGVWFPQMISGEGLFGDNTPKILEVMRQNEWT